MPRIMVGCKSIGKGYSSSTYSGERLVEPCESIRQALEAPASIPADSGNALLPNVHGPAELRELPAFGPVRPREQKSQIGRTQTLPTTCSASSPPRSGPATFANIVSNNLDCATSKGYAPNATDIPFGDNPTSYDKTPPPLRRAPPGARFRRWQGQGALL